MLLRTIRRVILIISILSSGATAFANNITVAPHTSAPPSEVAAPIRDLLAPGGAAAKVGGTSVELWWVKSVPVSGDGQGFEHVAEGTVIGAMRLAADFRDVRGRVIKRGVYVLRYGIQPQNGDHLGASPFREFLLPTPAADDKNPAPTGHDGTVELAAKTTGISHPAVFSIDPPIATDAPLTIKQNEAGHTALVVHVPTSRNGQQAGALKFGLILVGLIEV
jgi:hypothetical protein